MAEKITGTIDSVSDPRAFKVGKQTRADYFLLTMKANDGRKITIYLSSSSIGLNNESQSKIFVLDKKNKKLIKHRMVTPKRLLNTKIQVTGTVELKENGYYMNYVTSVIVL